MKPKIGTLTIDRFRAFRHLKIDGLGRVNLITGRNNTGKSSVLEALRILASDGSPSVMHSILRYREEEAGEADESARPLDSEGIFLFSTLFNGFPQFSDQLKEIVIATNDGQPMRVAVKAVWLSEERGEDGTRRLVPKQRELFGTAEPIPGLFIEAAGNRRIFPLDYARHSHSYGGRWIPSDILGKANLPCVFVSPYGGERTTTLGALWDKIALSDREKDVVEALRIIDPEISAVSMVGEGTRERRTAIVRANNLPRPVLLRSYGDGLNRLFGIVLSLVNAKDGILLVDEFENGMHHTVQLDAWRAIFRLAQKLDIQVFATSHSWDSIEAFQKAAAETPEEGVLVRLSRKGEDIIATVFAEDELAIVARERIEVR